MARQQLAFCHLIEKLDATCDQVSNLSGERDAVIANANSLGYFYIEVLATHRASATRRELLPIDAVPAPQQALSEIVPGMYIAGRDIEPGTYVGIAGESITDSCYCARLVCVQGTIGCVVTNNNAIGQFFVEVAPSDFAPEVRCGLEKVEREAPAAWAC